jgi:hypothetical protein
MDAGTPPASQAEQVQEDQAVDIVVAILEVLERFDPPAGVVIDAMATTLIALHAQAMTDGRRDVCAQIEQDALKLAVMLVRKRQTTEAPPVG